MQDVQKGKVSHLIEIGLIGIALLVITILHFRWLHAPYFYNMVLQFLYYLPVIYSAVRFGIRGGIIVALAASTAYAVHLLGHNLDLEMYMNHLLQIMLINLIGWVTGALSYRERQISSQYRRLSEKQTQLIAELELSHRSLAEVNNDLAQEIAERKILEERVRRSERLSAMGHLAAGVAHEMRNPLGIIRATMQIMEEEQKANPAVSEFSRVIKEECDRMNAVIAEFLQFARPAEPNFEPISLAELLDEVLLFTNKYISSQGIVVNIEIPEDLTPVMVDPGQLKQVFVNLIINAVEAMPKGGCLKISAAATPDGLEIAFKDSGMGIQKESLTQIFDPFYSTKATGTGLGLSIVCRILENHSGGIKVESKLGEGTEFIINLPRAGVENG
jgi:two-component system, NtrC family, sensor histidine kinase HydH